MATWPLLQAAAAGALKKAGTCSGSKSFTVVEMPGSGLGGLRSVRQSSSARSATELFASGGRSDRLLVRGCDFDAKHFGYMGAFSTTGKSFILGRETDIAQISQVTAIRPQWDVPLNLHEDMVL